MRERVLRLSAVDRLMGFFFNRQAISSFLPQRGDNRRMCRDAQAFPSMFDDIFMSSARCATITNKVAGNRISNSPFIGSPLEPTSQPYPSFHDFLDGAHVFACCT